MLSPYLENMNTTIVCLIRCYRLRIIHRIPPQDPFCDPQQGRFHFWLMDQDFHKPAVYLLDVKVIEHLNTDISGLGKILMKQCIYVH